MDISENKHRGQPDQFLHPPKTMKKFSENFSVDSALLQELGERLCV
jgi:hypothetical protein